MKKCNIVVRFAVVLQCALPVAVAAVVELPAPTGPFSIGRTLMHVDTDREEVWTDEPDDKREIPLVIWYPANHSSMAIAEYLPYSVEGNPERFKFERGWGSRLTIHTVTDAPFASEPAAFPVVLFSCGGGTGPWGYHMLVEDLVSHGFVVVGIDHPYEGVGQVLRNGKFIARSAPRFEPKPAQGTDEFDVEVRDWYIGLVDVRVEDVRSTVRELRTLNERIGGRFVGRLDLNRIGILGHSIGGVAAAHALVDVDGIKSGVNIDGHFDDMPFDEAHVPSTPFMCIEAYGPDPSDEELSEVNWTREEFEENRRSVLSRQAAAYRKNPRGGYRVTIDGADHRDFHDSNFLRSQGDADEGAKLVKVVEATRMYLLSFFRKTLDADDSTELDTVPSEFSTFTRVEKFGGTTLSPAGSGNESAIEP